jgi:hypothetical protein
MRSSTWQTRWEAVIERARCQNGRRRPLWSTSGRAPTYEALKDGIIDAKALQQMFIVQDTLRASIGR